MYLMTDRLLLRPVEYPDIDQLVAMWTDSSVACVVGGVQEREVVRDRLDEEAESPTGGAYGRWPLIEKRTGVVVGDCGLLEVTLNGVAETEISCMIAPHAQGRGYSAEIGDALLRFAFDILDASRVISLVDPACGPAAALVRELGMHRESVVSLVDGEVRELWVARRISADAESGE